MTLSLQEQSEIIRHLGVKKEHHNKIVALCQAVESEIVVEVIRGILKELIQVNQSRNEAAEGLIQADVLKWSENRSCSLKWRYKSLQHDLANLLGYRIEFHLPF